MKAIDEANTRISKAINEDPRMLNLSGLMLTSANLAQLIPRIKQELPLLKCLVLDANQLSEVPEEIGLLTTLEALRLNKHDLTALPEAIGACKKLRQLELTENHFTDVSEVLLKHLNLKALNLTDNPITAKAMTALVGIYGDRVLFNGTPFQLDKNSERVLEKVYPRRKVLLKSKYMAERKMRQIVSDIDALEVAGPFQDGEGEILNAQQVAYGLLTDIPYEGAPGQ